jgi:hypothetical protein
LHTQLPVNASSMQNESVGHVGMAIAPDPQLGPPPSGK